MNEEIGPYRLVRRLGEGGMGVVYEARHLQSGARAALKTVRPMSSGAMRGLRREIRVLSALRHPHIVEIMESGVHEGAPWYAMAYIEGRPLDARRSTGPRPEAGGTTRVEGAWWTHTLMNDVVETRGHDVTGRGQALQDVTAQASQAVARARSASLSEAAAPSAPASELDMAALGQIATLCDALAYLHGEGLVHRDVKPDNILVRADGHPVLVDFGLAAHSRSGVGREVVASLDGAVGTVAYMAPEQIRGDWVDARADLYALGCVLYEIVTSQRPFRGANVVTLLQKHVSETPRAPGQLGVTIPDALEALIMALLQKDPRDRPGYAEDVGRRLRASIAQLGVESSPPFEVRARPYLYRPTLSGRDAQLEALIGRLEALEGGAGGLVLVEGESGVGKTRLVIECLRRCSGLEIETLTGACRPVGEHVGGPLHPLLDALHVRVDACVQSPFVEVAVADALWALRDYLPRVASLACLADRAAPEPLPVDAARARLLTSLTRLLRDGSDDRPVCLVLDDLQWADALTLEWLEGVIAHGELAHGMMVLGTSRSEGMPDAVRVASRRRDALVLRPAPLDDYAAREMVRSMLAWPEAPDALTHAMSSRARGNPFFLAESLRAAIEDGLLARDARDAWHLTVGASTLRDSTSVREMVRRRAARLPDAARGALECLSVIGARVSPDFVVEVLARDADAGAACLDLLERRALLEFSAPDSVRIPHDAIREAIYESLSSARRLELHQRVADVYEARARAGAEEARHHLALHRLAAARSPEASVSQRWRAVQALRVASEDAASRHAPREAARHLQSALALLEQLPPTLQRDAQALALRVALGPLRVVTHGWSSDEVASVYRAALDAPGVQGDSAARFTALWGWWLVNAVRGEVDEARASNEALLGMSERLAKPELMLQAHHAAWFTEFLQGHFNGVLHHTREGVSLYARVHRRVEAQAQAFGGHDAGSCAHSFQAFALWFLGRPELAAESSRRALEIAASTGRADVMVHARSYAALLGQLTGDLEALAAHAARVLQLARDKGVEAWRAEALIFEGWSRVASGEDVAGGLRSLEQGLEAQVTGDILGVYYTWLYADACLKAGQDAAASEALERAFAMCPVEVGDAGSAHWWSAQLFITRGALLARRDQRTAARVALERARVIARAQGASALEARADEALGAYGSRD